MPVQQQGYRNFYVMFLPQHPVMQPKVADVEDGPLSILRRIVNNAGAAIGSPHYIGASMAPTLNTLLMMRMKGRVEPFASEPKLKRFAEFYMQLLTPPEIRFGGARKLVASGDGSTEGTEITGELATGFRSADPELAARLQGAWMQGGKSHSGFFGTTLLMIDENAPSKDPHLGGGNFRGYMSVLRNGAGTENETAAWLFNGDFYSDHRHDDRGSVVLYALGAPLSINWGAIYYPQTPGGNMKNMVIPENAFPDWNRGDQALTEKSGWSAATNTRYASFSESSFADAKMSSRSGLEWARTVYSIHAQERLPILMITDDFSGRDAAAPKVLTFNLMADGNVVTPDGTAVPPATSFDYDGSLKELPSAGTAITLKPGVNKFGFTGQMWDVHPTKGIDWDLYAVSDETLTACIGRWGPTWHPAREQAEFRKANGRPFEERQDILRIRGTRAFKTIIIPFRKGERPPALDVREDRGNVVITGEGEFRVSDAYYTFKDARRTIVTSFGAVPIAVERITIAGGPTEVIVEGNTATVTAHGERGRRTLTLPGAWVSASAVSRTGSTYTLDYQDDRPLTVTLRRVSDGGEGR
jgi:hypothetical protein